jgi:hypothetical protein
VNALYAPNAPHQKAAVLPEYDIGELICLWLDSLAQVGTISQNLGADAWKNLGRANRFCGAKMIVS